MNLPPSGESLEIDHLLTHHDCDEIDELVVPIADEVRPPRIRPSGEVRRVLEILDDIAVESLRSQSFEKSEPGKDSIK
ncbi:MAG: hypothetical protein ABI600_21300 [Luteolibacter sp.]